MVAEWVFDVWRKVATDYLIVRGVRQGGYIGWNGDICTSHSKLRETVKSREVEVIDEVNAFLEELRMSEAVFDGTNTMTRKMMSNRQKRCKIKVILTTNLTMKKRLTFCFKFVFKFVYRR